MQLEIPLSFEEWKRTKAAELDDGSVKSIDRLHNMDYKKYYEDLLTREYEEYLSDFNGNWLLK